MRDRLEIASGSIDITPQRACSLAGFDGRSSPFARIADPIELNAILLKQGSACALILAADLLYVGERIEAALRQRLQRAGLENCLVLAAASHTHFAPSVESEKPALGECDELFCEAYVKKAGALVDQLLDAPGTEARIRYVAGQAAHSINRRRLGWHFKRGIIPHRSVAMRANPTGRNDQTVHLLRFDGTDGRLLAFLWSYACHPVGFPRRLEVSAEFPGIARRRLRETHDLTVPVLFLQGFAGNLRPPTVVGPGLNPKRWLAQALQGPRFGSFSISAYEQWAGSLATLVADLSSSSGLREIGPSLQYETRSLPLRMVIDGDVGQQELRMIRLGLSNDVQLFAVTAEVVVEFVSHLQRLFPGVQTIPVGCVGSVYGYLPTDQMLEEGGYEAGDFFEAFSLSARFRPSVETAVVELMRQFAR